MSKTSLIQTIGALFISLFIIGALFPVELWGLHHLYFLSFSQKVTVFLLALASLTFPTKLVSINSSGLEVSQVKLGYRVFPIIGAILFGFTVWSYPIVYDPYGDAVIFEKYIYQIANFDKSELHDLISLSLDAWSGQKTVQALVSYVSNTFKITIYDAFRVIDIVSGLVFSFFWIYFLTRRCKGMMQVAVMTVVGLAAPFALNFFGRIEIYSPVLALIMVWIVVLFEYLDTRKGSWVALLCLMNLACLKAHPITVLLFPSTLFLVASHISPTLFSKLSWGNCIRFLFVPTTLIWLVLYFVVFRDHIDDRSLQQATMQYDHLFLPLFSPDPPLQNYNLLSLNHIGDFINVIFLWSPASIFMIIVGLLLGNLKQIISNSHFVLVAVPFMLLAGLLFVINPILSMPMDWDLYSIPAPFLLVLSVLVLGAIEAPFIPRMLPIALVITLLGSSFIALHTSTSSISKRLESVAIHVHKTYYEWTANILVRSDSIMALSPEVAFEKRQRVTDMLRPQAQLGVDREISELMLVQAKYLYKAKNQFSEAQKLLNEAVLYDPKSGNNQIALMELQFLKGDKEKAYEHSLNLLEWKFPSEEQALKMAIHCALEANRYEEAQKHCYNYLSNFENEFILSVYTRLVANDDIETLKLMFQQRES